MLTRHVAIGATVTACILVSVCPLAADSISLSVALTGGTPSPTPCSVNLSPWLGQPVSMSCQQTVSAGPAASASIAVMSGTGVGMPNSITETTEMSSADAFWFTPSAPQRVNVAGSLAEDFVNDAGVPVNVEVVFNFSVTGATSTFGSVSYQPSGALPFCATFIDAPTSRTCVAFATLNPGDTLPLSMSVAYRWSFGGNNFTSHEPQDVVSNMAMSISGAVYDLNGQRLSNTVLANANGIQLTQTVPEPSSWLLTAFGLMLAGLPLCRRRPDR